MTKKTLFTIPDVLTEAECRSLVAASEGRGYADAPVTTSRGFVMMPELRNNTRVMFDDPTLASTLWGRVRGRASFASMPAARAVGLNERFRFYRYEPGQAFRWHRDGAFVRNATERSHLTFMIYLNAGFDGGETELEDEVVVPRTGLALVFEHSLRHQGAEVRSGRKYVLRSDVMFTTV